MFNIENRIRPILKWAGGKSGLLPQLIENFPPTFNRLVEPFVGGGAVFFALQHGVPALINDGNSELIELYNVVRDTPEDLIKALDKLTTQYSEAFYYQLRSHKPKSVVCRAARMVFLNKTGFNGLYRQNSQGGFNVPFGKRVTCPLLYDRGNLFQASLHLRNACIKNLDFEDIIDATGIGDLVYCDPPYEPLSITSSFTAYKASKFSQNDQQRLKNAVIKATERGAYVVISNSTADFILNLYNGWDVRRVFARRAINSKGNGRGEIAEVLLVREPVAHEHWTKEQKSVVHLFRK
jgi:DNA adenine methylase